MFRKSEDTVKGNNDPQVVSLERSIFTETDTDSDGVKDWEEIIWQTDPNNASTYGVSDQDYIRTQVETSQNGRAIPNTPIETTDDLSKQLFAEYLAMKQSGDINPENVALLVERINQNVFAQNTEGLYNPSNLTTFSPSDRQKLALYAQTLVEARNRYAEVYASQSGAITLGDDFPNQMLFASDIYLKLSEEVMTMEVPQGAESYHLAYANSLKESAQGLKELGSEEPLSAVLGVKRHSEAQIKQEGAITSLGLFLTQNGIISFNLLLL